MESPVACVDCKRKNLFGVPLILEPYDENTGWKLMCPTCDFNYGGLECVNKSLAISDWNLMMKKKQKEWLYEKMQILEALVKKEKENKICL